MARPASSAVIPNVAGILEVEAEDEHQPVDRARPDQDAERGPDQCPILHQVEVDQWRIRAALHIDEGDGGDNRDKNEPSVAGEVHPQSDPLLTASMNGARMAATRKVPSQSMLRDRFGPTTLRPGAES